MEGQSSQEKLQQLMSFASGVTGNHDSHSAEDDSNLHFVIASEGNGSHWTCLPKPSYNYVEYLEESSTCLPKTANENMIGCSYEPIGSINNVNEVNGTDRSFFYNHPGKVCVLKPTDPSTDIDIRKLVGFWRSDESEVHADAVEFESTQHHLPYAENYASRTAESIADKHNVSRLNPVVTEGTPGFLLKGGCSSSKQKAYATDSQRRQCIADNLKALHELLPNPAEGSQEYVLDDIIDYVKYLKLQIKELTGSRLQAASTAIPLIFHEGYGHYISQQMLNEPLEEMMVKLLEEHPAAGGQLLESKGLFLMPMALVEDLRQATHMFGGSALV